MKKRWSSFLSKRYEFVVHFCHNPFGMRPTLGQRVPQPKSDRIVTLTGKIWEGKRNAVDCVQRRIRLSPNFIGMLLTLWRGEWAKVVPDARDREREWARIQNVSVIIIFQLNIFSTTHKQQTSTKGSETPLGHTQSDVDYRQNGDDADGNGVASSCTWLRWHVTFSFRWCPVVRSRCQSPSLSPSHSLTLSCPSLCLWLSTSSFLFSFSFYALLNRWLSFSKWLEYACFGRGRN